MANVRRFDEFKAINEGGNALDQYTTPIPNSEVPDTLKFVSKNVLPLIGLEGLDIDAAVLGSAGKKPPAELSGDIDIAVSIDKIAGHAGIPLEDVLDYIERKMQKAGFQTNMQRGFHQVNVAIPIGGDKKKGYVQIDLMCSDNLEWSKFAFHSPDYRKAESRYKGAHRGMLVTAVASEGMKEVVKTHEPTGEMEEYEQMVYRNFDGLYKTRKTMMGKKGLVKTPKILKDYEKKITNIPEEAVEILFGKGVKPNDVNTFEKAWKAIHAGKFPFPGKRETIANKFLWYMRNLKLPVPSEIKDKYPHLIKENFEPTRRVKLFEELNIDSDNLSE